jgi:thymidylate synthase ThyX
MKIEKIIKDLKIKKNEIPITKFIDNLNAVKVTLIDWPDEERLKKVFVNMSTGSWYPNYFERADKEEVNEEIHDLLSGKMLGQGLEAAQFTFLVEGVSLHGTHAIVRNRIGISYLQQSTAVKDYRHSDVLVPRAFTRHLALLEKYKKWVLDGKKLYAELLDTNDIAITDARMALPKTIPAWIYISCNLMTLLSIYAKRSDTQEEYPELNEMVKQMKILVVDKFPYLSTFFVSNCEKGTCLHCKQGLKANCIFKRDEIHSKFLPKEYNDVFTMHEKTKKELMLDANEYISETYIGDKKYIIKTHGI